MGAVRIFFSTLSAAAVFAAPVRADEARDFPGVNAVVFEDLIAAVDIRLEGSDGVAVVKTDGANAAYPVHMDVEGGVLTIRSDENPDKTRWWKEVDWRRHKGDAFAVFLKDYPTIVVTAPPQTDLSFDSAVVSLKAGDGAGALAVEGGHVDGAIGDVETATVMIAGSGDLTVGDVAGVLNAAIHGSGDFTAASAQTLSARIHGSGDLKVGDVGGDAEAAVHGSGDMRLGAVDGPIEASIMGSGDIEAGAVDGGADVSVHGSGDLSLARVEGATRVSINGSGDVRIGGGLAENLRVRIMGSGEFEHFGVATNPDIAANGSGDVYIQAHEGSVRARGDGDIRIGAVRYGDDD